MLKTKKTIKVNGAKITLVPVTAWSLGDGEIIRNALIYEVGTRVEEDGVTMVRVGPLEAERFGRFILMVLSTNEVKGDLGFEWPSTNSSLEALVGAYQAIPEHLTAEQLSVWVEACREVNIPPGDTDTSPENPVTK